MNRCKPSFRQTCLPGLALLLLAGCGGGGSGSTQSTTPPTSAATVEATALSYTNPISTGYSLQADPATNNTGHLALHLVGPAGSAAQGLSIFLTADPAMVSWSQTQSVYATPGAVFNLGSSPQAFVTRVSSSGGLQVGLYQKSGTATYTTAPLFAVALDLKAGVVPSGTTVALATTLGQQAVFVDGSGTVQNLPAIAIGPLVAN